MNSHPAAGCSVESGQALLDSLTQLDRIVGRSPMMVFMWRLEPGYPVDFASGNVAQLGYSPEAFTSGDVSWTEITHPDDLPRLEAEVARFLQTEADTFSQHYRLRSRDGTYRWVEDHNRVVRGEDGRPTHVQGVVMDVTERRRAEDALRNSETRMRAVLDALPDLIFVVDEDGTYIEVLAEEEDLLYREARELKGRRMHDVLPPAMADLFLATVRATIETGNPQVVEYELEVNRGLSFFEGRTAPLEVATDGKRAVVCVARDMTAHKRALSALTESEENFRTMAVNASEAIFISDPNGRHLYANRCACELTGYSSAELAALTVEDILVPGERRRIGELRARRLAGKDAPRHYETLLLTRDGRHVPVEVTGARTAWKGAPCTLGMLRDITDRRRLEQDLLAVSNREKRQIGEALHDSLGQQLSGIGFLAKALERTLGAEDHAAQSQAAQIRALVQEAISQSRDLAYSLSPVDIREAGLASALQRFAETTHDLYGMECRCDVRDPGTVENHEVALNLYHIAQEAVSNALRHSGCSRIAIRLAPGHVVGRLSIEDNGSGIPDPLPETAGLGIRIMRHRAEMIGGALDVNRAREGGTLVVCTFEDRPIDTQPGHV